MGENVKWLNVCACIGNEMNANVHVRACKELAKVFDDVVIDGFRANWCYSGHGIENLNRMFGLAMDSEMLLNMLWIDEEVQRLWSLYSYFQELLLETSRKIIESVKEVNGKARIILKFAEWCENSLTRGLSPRVLSNALDDVYLGTESGDDTLRYGSAFVVDCIRAIVGDKLGGIWFESYNWLALPSDDETSDAPPLRVPQSYPELLVEQFRYSLPSYVNEITLLQRIEYPEKDRGEHVALLERAIPWLIRIESVISTEKASLNGSALQIACRSPYDSYLEYTLRVIGVPVIAKAVERLVKWDLVLVKENSSGYLNLWELNVIGVNVLLTPAAIERVGGGCLGHDLLGLVVVEADEAVSKEVAKAVAFSDNVHTYVREHRRPYAYLVELVLKVKHDVKAYLWALWVDWGVYPVLYEVNHGSESVSVVSVTKYQINLVRGFHEAVRQAIRGVAYSFVGIKFEYRVPGGESRELSNISILTHSSRKPATLANNDSYALSFSIAVDREVLRIKDLEESALGNVKVELAEEKNDVLRLGMNMAKHSIDTLAFTQHLLNHGCSQWF